MPIPAKIKHAAIPMKTNMMNPINFFRSIKEIMINMIPARMPRAPFTNNDPARLDVGVPVCNKSLKKEIIILQKKRPSENPIALKRTPLGLNITLPDICSPSQRRIGKEILKVCFIRQASVFSFLYLAFFSKHGWLYVELDQVYVPF